MNKAEIKDMETILYNMHTQLRGQTANERRGVSGEDELLHAHVHFTHPHTIKRGINYSKEKICISLPYRNYYTVRPNASIFSIHVCIDCRDFCFDQHPRTDFVSSH